MRPDFQPIGILLLVAVFSGCWVKEEVGNRMQADIAVLQVETEVVKKAHAEEKTNLQKRIVTADQKIAELEKVVDEYRRATGRNAADFGVDIERIKSQLMELRGTLEVAEHRVGIIENRLDIRPGDMNAGQTEGVKPQIETGKTTEQLQRKDTSRSTSRDDPLSAIKRPEKKNEFYKLAYGLLDSGQVDAARILFREFLQKWPSDAYSDNALYWIAESYYVRRDYRQAAMHFQQVRQKYSKGDKAADALLKLGYCFFSMKKYRESLPFFRQFVQSYPKNGLVKKARQKIGEVEKRLRSKSSR